MQFVQNHQSSNTTVSTMGNVSTAPPSPKAPHGVHTRTQTAFYLIYIDRHTYLCIIPKHHQATKPGGGFQSSVQFCIFIYFLRKRLFLAEIPQMLLFPLREKTGRYYLYFFWLACFSKINKFLFRKEKEVVTNVVVIEHFNP